nr:hypothetical protein Iba_chr13cCG8950 [Ipomoea batatas]
MPWRKAILPSRSLDLSSASAFFLFLTASLSVLCAVQRGFWRYCSYQFSLRTLTFPKMRSCLVLLVQCFHMMMFLKPVDL